MFIINLSIKTVVPQKHYVNYEVMNKKSTSFSCVEYIPFQLHAIPFTEVSVAARPGKMTLQGWLRGPAKAMGAHEWWPADRQSFALSSIGPNCTSTACVRAQGEAGVHLSVCILSGQKYDKAVINS